MYQPVLLVQQITGLHFSRNLADGLGNVDLSLVKLFQLRANPGGVLCKVCQNLFTVALPVGFQD